MNKDLTVGKPESVLWRFCLPLFGSIIFQQLYNLADSFVAGKFVGESALAAVGNSYEITLIFIAFAFGCNIGCSVIVSQLFGAKRMADLKTAVYTTLISSGVVCLLLMGLGTLLCTDLLQLINTPEDILPDSKLYLDIYILGLPFVFYYNVATGIFSALGDSKTPFYFLAASSLSNIAVDILFVTAFKMGVAGVAWATFLCQGVSCVLALVVVFRRFRTIEAEKKPALFSWTLFKKIAVVAVPSILQQSFISVGNIVIQGGLFCRGEDEQSGDHLLHHPWQRHFQLYRPEHRCGKAGACPSGLRGRAQAGVAAVCAPGGAVSAGRRRIAADIPGRYHRHGHAGGHPIPAHPVALLLCGVCKAGVRRHPAGSRNDEAIHGCDVYGPYPSCGPCRGPFRSLRNARHLVCLAHRLDDCHGPVCDFLQTRSVE